MSKKKKSKKKLSKEEDETTRSEVNLLTASTDPNLKVDSDDETTHNDEHPVKPEMTSMSIPEAEVKEEKPVSKERSSVSSKKKSYRNSSDSSIRDQLADSHSSLRDYFPDPALKTYLQGLHDDVESFDGEDEEYSPRRYTPSPILLPIFPPSQHSGKVFLEKDSGFRTTTQRKLTSKLPGNQIQPDVQKPTKTPLDLSLDCQRIFRSVGIFCHGFLAGLAFWQLIMVFILTEEMIDLKEFIKLYSPMSQPLYMIFYFLTVICTISIMDRYDIAKFEWRQLQKLLTFKSGGLAIVIYAFSLIITLITTRMDDYLSLYEHNATLFNFEDEKFLQDLEHEMTSWKALNLCRSIAVILGWLVVSLRPNTDLLYKNLKRLSTYDLKPEYKESA